MADLTQAKYTLIPHSHVQHPDSIEGTPVTVDSFLKLTIVMWHALVEAVANTDPGKFRVFGSLDLTGDDHWFHILDVDVTDATPATEPLSANVLAGARSLPVLSTTGFAARDHVYVRDTNGGFPQSMTGSLAGDELNSEWHAVDKVVANSSIDIMMGVANAKDTSDEIWGSAQQFRVTLGSGLARVRVDFSHEGATGANCHVKAELRADTDIA